MITKLSSALRQQWPNLILGSILAALLLNCLYGRQGPQDLLNLRLHHVALVKDLDQLSADNALLRERVAKLRSDDAYLQRLIRQEFGYARPNEFVYRFRASKEQTKP